jgi:protoporphyrinogen IX oxidase
MIEWLLSWYLWIKAIHILAVIAWMAGLLYLPRLFVYHTGVKAGSNQDKMFQKMEMRLLRVIMNPAMITTLIFGFLLFLVPRIVDLSSIWFSLKLIFVIMLIAFHMALAKWRRKFSEETNEKSEGFFRKVNEIPTVLMIIIVILVVVKPF